jgi:hypothetical protein
MLLFLLKMKGRFLQRFFNLLRLQFEILRILVCIFLAGIIKSELKWFLLHFWNLIVWDFFSWSSLYSQQRNGLSRTNFLVLLVLLFKFLLLVLLYLTQSHQVLLSFLLFSQNMNKWSLICHHLIIDVLQASHAKLLHQFIWFLAL